MDKIAILPLFIAFGLLLYKEPREMFIYYFLPILTVFPIYYQTELAPGLPEFSFWSSALLPIFVVWVVNKRMEGYKISWLDLIIVVHLLVVFYGQWTNSTYKEAQKVLFNDVMARFIPYMMAKTYFSDPKSRIQMLKIIVIVGGIVGFFNMYEFRMWSNVFDSYLRDIWPFHVPWDLPMKRGGFKRAFGPFGHPISAGYFFAIVLPIAFWLWREGYFKKKLLGFALTLLCIGGGIASISRAPILGMILGFFIIWFGWIHRKVYLLGLLFIIFSSSMLFLLPKIVEYVNVDRSTAQTEEQRTVAYRKELLDNYLEVLEEKPWLGWGRFTVPVVKRQKSIDNEYLNTALVSGKIALYLYILGILWILFRLFYFALKQPYNSKDGRLAWCLLAGWISAIFTQTTVFAGTQTVQFFYILTGMSEALLISPKIMNNLVPSALDLISRVSNRYGFSRTIPGVVQRMISNERIENVGFKNGYNFYRTL